MATIRKNYRECTKWSYQEASDYSSASVETIRVWACRKKFKPGFKVGPLKVDANSFIRFLETGKPQA